MESKSRRVINMLYKIEFTIFNSDSPIKYNDSVKNVDFMLNLHFQKYWYSYASSVTVKMIT